MTIGGQTADGFDATNELSYVLLESTRPLESSYPELGVRIHANTPDKFLHAVAETIKDGKGSPKLINDEFEVPWFMSNGIEKREALDYAMSGCSESRLPNRETHKTGNSAINYGAVMEMTLRDGRMKFYKDEQFGLKTGDPRTFKTYDDLWNAFRLQIENVVKHFMIQVYTAPALKPKYIAAPLASTLHDLCMEHGRDLHTHGDYIPGALDASCIDGLGGFATASIPWRPSSISSTTRRSSPGTSSSTRWRRTGRARRPSARCASMHRSTATASSGWTRSATRSSARSWSMPTSTPSRMARASTCASFRSPSMSPPAR